MNKRVLSTVVLAVILSTSFAAAQVTYRITAPNGLDLLAIGDGSLRDGTKTAFRVYAAPDGSKGKVIYTKLGSLEPAQRLIEEWLKATRTITSREKDLTIAGQLVSDRIVGLNKLPKSDKTEFVIIRRDELICYLIESESLQTATKIESLIEHTPDKN